MKESEKTLLILAFCLTLSGPIIYVVGKVYDPDEGPPSSGGAKLILISLAGVAFYGIYFYKKIRK
jgi:hypothetical protein